MRFRRFLKLLGATSLLVVLPIAPGFADNPKKPAPVPKLKPSGPDYVGVTGSFTGSCYEQDCTQCPYTTLPIFIKNQGNVTVNKQVTVVVKFQNQIVLTWTGNAPAAGAKTKIGTYTSFLWNCPVTHGEYSPNYFIIVDTTNAVTETDEQNNVHGIYLKPDKTTFHGN
jgi:hypothetical protein